MPVARADASQEDSLQDYDKTELAAEYVLIAKAEQCKQAGLVASERLKALEAEKKTLDKRAPDFKAASKKIDKEMVTMKGVASRSCRIRHPGCVPTQDSTRVPTPSSIADYINRSNNARIDFIQLSKLEGGAHTQGYIPWWPHFANGAPTIDAIEDSTGKIAPRLKGDLDGRPDNKSGATIGVGVDLGQGKAEAFFGILDLSNKGEHGISETELEVLKQKILPYFGKQRGEACKFLRENPLTLTEKEVTFLNKAAHEDALKQVKKFYRKYAEVRDNVIAKSFSDLSTEQQTALFSHAYQYGTPKHDFVNSLIAGNKELLSKKYREYDYLYKFMSSSERNQ